MCFSRFCFVFFSSDFFLASAKTDSGMTWLLLPPFFPFFRAPAAAAFRNADSASSRDEGTDVGGALVGGDAESALGSSTGPAGCVTLRASLFFFFDRVLDRFSVELIAVGSEKCG